MAAAERNRTERETILKARKKPLASLEELAEACLPTFAARLWATCCWPETMAEGWKIGDHNFLVAEVRPDSETCLYVQFWSEAYEPVDAEVCSGEWNPGAVKYVRQRQRDRLKALGYTVGGQASNFQKELQVQTSAEAEAVAREALDIFFKVFGYRGQWPLELEWHQGERAELASVYSSVTPEDFAKLAIHLGFEIEVHGRRRPVVHLRHGKRQFVAGLGGRIPDTNLYSIVTLETVLASPRAIDDAMVERINDAVQFAQVSRVDQQTLVLSLPLRFDGGVTGNWMANAFQHWLTEWRATQRLVSRKPKAMRAKRRRAADDTVH